MERPRHHGLQRLASTERPAVSDGPDHFSSQTEPRILHLLPNPAHIHHHISVHRSYAPTDQFGGWGEGMEMKNRPKK